MARPHAGAPRQPAPTYAHDVARVLNAHCVQCHHPSGPCIVPLLTYEDARRRARQIARVTARRYMPPWLPDPGHVRIVGENRLSAADIAMLD